MKNVFMMLCLALALSLSVMSMGCMEPESESEEVSVKAQGICSSACGGLDFEDWTGCIDASCGPDVGSAYPGGSWAEGPNNTRYCSLYWHGPYHVSCNDTTLHHEWDKEVYCSNGSHTFTRVAYIDFDSQSCGGSRPSYPPPLR